MRNNVQAVRENPLQAAPADVQQFLPRAKRISEAAAMAAQHVIDLEAANENLHDQLMKMRNLLQFEEERNKALSTELVRVKLEKDDELRRVTLEKDFHQQFAIEVLTKLKTSAAILVDCVKMTPPDLAETVKAVKEAVETPLPAAEM